MRGFGIWISFFFICFSFRVKNYGYTQVNLANKTYSNRPGELMRREVKWGLMDGKNLFLVWEHASSRKILTHIPFLLGEPEHTYFITIFFEHLNDYLTFYENILTILRVFDCFVNCKFVTPWGLNFVSPLYQQRKKLGGMNFPKWRSTSSCEPHQISYT